jgi:N-acetylmuramoyl-L-alanine amidase
MEYDPYQRKESSWLKIVGTLVAVLLGAGVLVGALVFMANRAFDEPSTASETPAEENVRLQENVERLRQEQAEAAAVAMGASSGTATQTTETEIAVEEVPTVGDTPVTTSSTTGVLAGKVIVIDPGHQAKANTKGEPIGPGASETKPKVAGGTRGVVSKVPESKVVLDIGLQLRDALVTQGATVIMTREVQKIDISNSARAKIANEAHADLFLRLHCDGGGSASIHGISMLVPKKNKWTAPIVKSSASAGKTIQKALIKATGAKDNGVVPRSDLSGFNWCEVPSVLVEMGFMTNKAEDKKLNDPVYQQKLVTGLTTGCVNWLTR